MPGSIQSIERAAAVLRVLGTAEEPLGLADVAAALSLPKPTAHGILRTLQGVGFVDQVGGGRTGAGYVLGDGLHRLGTVRIDAQELRSRSMNWADELASRTRLAVLVGVLSRGEVLIAHHVFRPDDSPQRLRTGERLPAHATALGKVLLAHTPAATSAPRGQSYDAYTTRTITVPSHLAEALAAARAQGWACDAGEHVPEQAGLAAPVRGPGGTVVGAVSVIGPLEAVLDRAGGPRRAVREGLVHAAGEIGAAVAEIWTARP